MKKKDVLTTIVIYQSVMFEKAFDYPEEIEKAKTYLESLQRNYRGYYHMKILTDKEFKKLMGITEKVITDIQLSEAVGNLIRS